MNSSIQEMLDFIEENDIKFVRLSFVDLEGVQKNLSVMAGEFEEAAKNGVVFDGTVAGFKSAIGEDLRLLPDFSTLHILPWRPQHGRVARFLCSIKDLNGNTSVFDVRAILQKAVKDLKGLNLTCNVGTDSEFYLFKTDSEGYPTKITQDNAGYFDLAPLDKGENVRREICLCLEEMGIKPLSSHHERGPGQNEINFADKDALSACDNQVIYKSVVKAIASRNGLFASFMPKPLEYESGNGLAVNFQLYKEKEPLFSKNELTTEAESFIAGIINRAREMGLFFNSIPNSYERLGEFNAPSTAEFVNGDRTAFSRIAAKGVSKRFELRSIDSACNIYLVVALVLQAGIRGIKNGETISKAKNVYLPKTIDEAICEANKSEFLREVLGEELLTNYISVKKALSENYANDKSAQNLKEFEII